MVKPPAIPSTPPPPPPPTPIDTSVLEARRRERQRAAGMGGLGTTIHTSPAGATGAISLGTAGLLGTP